MSSINLRPFTEEDRDFVTSSFLYSYGASAFAEAVPAKVLVDALEPLIIAWPTTIAVSSFDPDVAIGWLCAKGPDHVAWLFVKPHFRHQGVAKALLAHAGVGKFINAAFVPTKSPVQGQSFQKFIQAHGFRVNLRPHLPQTITAELAT